MTCPAGASGETCSSRGLCLTLGEAATKSVRHGWRQGADEVQTLNCSLTSGSFYIKVGFHESFPISYNASEASFRSILEELPTVGLVDVSFAPGPTACLAEGNVITITFTSQPEGVSLLEATSPSGVTSTALQVALVQDATRITFGATQGDETTWDADKLTMCHCDGRPDYNKTRPINATYTAYTGTTYVGYSGAGLDKEVDIGLFEGPACEFRPCPYGPDPLLLTTSLGELETQILTCTIPSTTAANNVSRLLIGHLGQWTAPLDFNSTETELKLALEGLASVGVVSVNFTSGVSAAGVVVRRAWTSRWFAGDGTVHIRGNCSERDLSDRVWRSPAPACPTDVGGIAGRHRHGTGARVSPEHRVLWSRSVQ
jgi:hypothetical protein